MRFAACALGGRGGDWVRRPCAARASCRTAARTHRLADLRWGFAVSRISHRAKCLHCPTEVLMSSRTARQVFCSSGLQRPLRSSARRDMLRRLVGSLVALVAIEVLAQVRLPDGWVTDYDYEENL